MADHDRSHTSSAVAAPSAFAAVAAGQAPGAVGEAAVIVRGLTTGYNQQPAVSDITFTVARGEMAALVGPNGSGKSTIIRALIGLQAPWQGEVRIFGADPRAARARVGYMPQAERVDWGFPLSVTEAVALGLYQRRPPWRRFHRTVDRARVDAALDRLGIGPLAGRQVGELSGGQRRRVLLARTLVRDPDLLLLDEPAAGLDAAVEEDLLDLFQDLAAEGKALIVATHDIPCVYRCYHTALCVNRRLVAAGPPRATLTEGVLEQTFGRHLVVFRVADRTYGAEPHTEHPLGAG